MKIRNYGCIFIQNMIRHKPKLLGNFCFKLIKSNTFNRDFLKILQTLEKPLVLDSTRNTQ